MKKQQVGKDQAVDNPFSYAQDQLLFAYDAWSKARRCYNKSGKTAISKGTSNSRPIIMKKESIQTIEPTAITDIDTTYFTDLAHRPIKGTFSRQRYIDEIQRVLRTELLIGYERNECLRINQKISEEQKRLNAVERQYRYYNSAFEDYLSNDHETSMKILDEARQHDKRSSELVAKRDILLNNFGQVRLEVYQSEEMWRIARMCQEFLQRITSSSPQSTGNEPTQNAESNGTNSQRNSIVGTLECLVDAFERDIKNDDLGSGGISLQDPHELAQIFAAIEQRNLDALIHLESLAGPIAEMTTNIVRAEELIGGEIRLIEESLEELKSHIDVSEQRMTELESYSVYLLNGVFRELVCSDSVLRLRVFTENTYESCVGPNDANLDCYSMMQVIEKTYESLNMTLDNLPHKIVEICEKEGFAQEMRIMREAEDAGEKFDLMHRLLVALERIMDPPYYDQTLKSKQESKTHGSKLQLTMPSKSAGKTWTVGRPQSYVAVERPRLFFNKKCRLRDWDIFDKSTIETKQAIAHEISTKMSPKDDHAENRCDGI